MAWEDKRIHTFSKCVRPIGNESAEPKFELAYNDFGVQYANQGLPLKQTKDKKVFS